jgi:hypothetical protein
MNTELLQTIKSLIETARASVTRQVDSTMTLTYFLIGRYIVEDEQQGEQRASYATSTLKYLSAELTKSFGRGYSEDNLGNMRRFYLAYRLRFAFAEGTLISEKLSRKTPSGFHGPITYCSAASSGRRNGTFMKSKPCITTGASRNCSASLTARFTNGWRSARTRTR